MAEAESESVTAGGGSVRARLRIAAFLVVIAWVASAPGTAAAFGTIDGGGQNREHERITRASLACAGDAGSSVSCFQPTSMSSLAGHDRAFGAVGAPDSDEVSDPAAHCDDADFLAGGYPRTRDQATTGLLACVNHLRVRFDEGVDSAAGLLDDEGRLIQSEVDLEPDCRAVESAEPRAKCAAIGGLGRALHGVQDFYSHSNWADEADPSRPIGPDNPPGLNMPGPSSVLDLRSATSPVVPADLSTGCYVLKDQVPGTGECENRVTHAALNKDNGLIDINTGKATAPTTPRGMIADNFTEAVSGAITETRRQWQDFQNELTARYGEEKADLMVCALTHDDPVSDCAGGETGRTVGILAIAGTAVAAGATMLLVGRRRQLG